MNNPSKQQEPEQSALAQSDDGRLAEKTPIDFSQWRFRAGGWEAPDADLARWCETLDNRTTAIVGDLPSHLQPPVGRGGGK